MIGRFFIRLGTGFGGIFAVIGAASYLWGDRASEGYLMLFIIAAVIAVPCWIVGWACGGFDE